MADDEAARLLAELGIGTGGGGKKKAAAKAQPADAAAAQADEAEGGDDGDAAGEGAAKKKKKKKPSAAPKPPAVEEKKEAPAPKKEAAAPKLSNIAKAAQKAQLQAQQLREEQARLEEEARIKEEEEKRAEEERSRLEAEEKELKRKKKEEKKARLLAEGKPVTKAEKEKARKLAEARAQFLAMGMVNPDAIKAQASESKEKKKDEKERKKAEKERKKKEEEEAARIAAEAKAAAEAPAPKVEKDWDEESDSEDLVKQLQSRALQLNEVVVIPEVSKSVAPKPAAAAPAKPAVKKAAEKPGKKEKPAPAAKGAKGKTAASAKEQEESSGSESGSEEEDSESEESDSESDGSSDSEDQGLRERIEEARRARLARTKKSLEVARATGVLRSPICCVLGHVDTGKTKILDMLRKTNVQEGEAGGITQQIGATFFPCKNMLLVTERLPQDQREQFKIPGLLVIDTPGHEAFSNLRSRGSGLADVAILVIDIMHGLEQQTIESIELLKKRDTKFVVALNKVDRLYEWKVQAGAPIRQCLAAQKPSTVSEFETRTKNVITQLMEQGLNAKLYWENDSWEDTVSICPTSAITGEGSPDLINTVVKVAQTQKFDRLCFSNELECTVLEIKKIEGLGTTIDVCLVNGELHDDDTLVLASFNGPIVTQVRSLLTPQPMREMRVKGDYILHKTIKGAMGIKITCQADLENVVAGTSVFQVTPEDDVEELKDAVMKDVADNLTDISTVPRGVFVQASTLGSLEGLMVHLRKENIPVAGVAVGPVIKKDVTRASAMLESKGMDPDTFEKEYASILAFNVKVDNDARDYAEKLGMKIFTDETIYNLTDQYLAYAKETRAERKKSAQAKAVFPCIVKIIPGNVFNSKNPLVLGVDVVRGCIVEGTPIVVPNRMVDDPDNKGEKKMLELGRVVGIEKDRVKVDKAVRGEKVCIKIQGGSDESSIQVGRHFEISDQLVSRISRKSIDVLKAFFKEDVDKLKTEGWPLVVELKKLFKIQDPKTSE